MSYSRQEEKGKRGAVKSPALAKAMQQGDQPKHGMGNPSLAGAMQQGGGKAGDKGSCYQTLGSVLKQSSK